MQRYVLPTLISLALATPLSFADQHTAAEPAPAEMSQPAAPYGMAPPPVPNGAVPPVPMQGAQPYGMMPPAYDAEMMKKRFEHRREMEAQMQKIMETSDPAERRRLMEARMKEMQKHMEEMREVMGGGMYGRNMRPHHRMMPPAPPRHWEGGYGQPTMPPYGPHYGQWPEMGRGMPYGGPRKQGRMMSHRQQMEQRLARIEELLEKLVAAQEKAAQ